MAKRKQTDIVQFMLRLREGLRKRLETAATAKEISLNAEINGRLEASFEWEDRIKLVTITESLNREFERAKQIREKLEAEQEEFDAEKLALMTDMERNFVKEMRAQARAITEELRTRRDVHIEAERHYRRLAAALEGRTVSEEEDKRRAMEIEARPHMWPPNKKGE